MKIDATLITGRTINQGANIEAKTSQGYFEAAAICELNSGDIADMGAANDSNVKVTTPHGSVVVKIKGNDGNPKGIAFIPMGPWANALVDPDTAGCGMPGFKGIPSVLEPTKEEVPSMKELMARLKEV